jgi:VPDSG-CTERM motif
MKTLILAAIRGSLMFTAVTASLFCDRPAEAYTVTLEQMGSNVVANGSGPINLTGLTFLMRGVGEAVIKAANPAFILTGAVVGVDIYEGITGPTSFGSGDIFFPTTSSGDPVGIRISDMTIGVPHGYVSGAALSDSMTFNNATFASLGLTPGTYEWTWGARGANQNFTLIIGEAGVPDGGSTVSLLGFALLGLAAFRRKLSC